MSARFSVVGTRLLALLVCAIVSIGMSRAQDSTQLRLIPGANVNMVSGTQWPNGDPYLQRQNEPSIAVSTRNPMHVMAGANDYRTVDIPGLPGGIETGDSWLGVFWSNDAGDSWQSTLLPGYPQEPVGSSGRSSPLYMYQYKAGADPVVRAGTNGMFYYSGIAFDRATSPKSTVFVARFIDMNNEEGGSPIKYIDTTSVKKDATGTYFIDKPWMAVDIPRSGAATGNIQVPGPNGTTITQSFACGNVYIAWTEILGTGTLLQSRIMFSRSTDCGATWATPVQLSAANTLNQGATIAIAPDTGNVYVAWRQFPLPSTSGCTPAPFQKYVTRFGHGYWKNNTNNWPVQSLTLGGVTYTKTQLIKILNTQPTGDATYILAYQLIAAKLNYAQDPNAAMPPNMKEADAWLSKHKIGSKPKTSDVSLALAYAANLEKYNQGVPLDVCVADPANKIMAVRSDPGGTTFFGATSVQPYQVSKVNAFDQGTTNISFRSTAYPTMAVDDTGRVYVAWTTRGLATSRANPDPVSGDSRIVVSSLCGGGSCGISQWPSWTVAQPIDQPNVPGHQIKPTLCFTAGKLFMLYYDFREDVSQNFQQYIADLATLQARHTVDVRAAMADPEQNPKFTDYSLINLRPSDQMSRYAFLMLQEDVTPQEPLYNRQIQFNPPNLPLFLGGTAPFHGDYVDLSPVPAFVMNSSGEWAFNTAPSNGSMLQATWTDNRDVKAPPDGNWKLYVPPTNPNSGGTSIYDPTQKVPVCQTTQDGHRTGMRNQNIYNTRVSSGLYVAVPGNSKPLGEMQRAFVVYVQNTTTQNKYFRLQVVPSENVQASFAASGAQPSLDVAIVAYSSVARTVFVSGQSAQGSVQIRVFEITGVGGSQATGGLESSVMLNPDPTNPPPADSSLLSTELYNPAIMNPAIMNPAIMNPAIMNPAIMNPAIMNPAIMNPAIMNPAIMNPAIMNPAIMNPAIMNPAIMNPAIMNPAIMNPAIMNPAIMNPAIMNAAVDAGTLKQANWVVQNNGNTTTGYTFNALLPNPPAGLIYQLLVYRLYMTPVADGCTLKEEAQQELLVNVVNPDLSGSLFRNGQLSSDAAQPTFYLDPGKYAIATLLAFPDPQVGGTTQEILNRLNSFHAGDVSGGVVPEPGGNTARMLSPSLPALGITTNPANVPGATLGLSYNYTLTASGGYLGSGGNYNWSFVAGILPPGLTLGSNGTISGTPTTAGTFNFTVQVADYAQTATLNLTITIIPAPVASLQFVTPPSNAVAGQNMPLIQVKALDSTNGTVPNATITLSSNGPYACPGPLSGATAVTGSGGVADFSVSKPSIGGWGCTLNASVGLVNVTSSAFDVVGFAPTGNEAVSSGTLRTATLLPNGKVLVAGGSAGLLGSNVLSSAELYDPATGIWSATGSMVVARQGAATTLLPNGKVLVAGGEGWNNGQVPLSSVELYDPATEIWSSTGSMNAARGIRIATLLPNGKVLVAGGWGFPAVSAELYDPATGLWSATGSMTVSREANTATLLSNGKVLVAGGIDDTNHAQLSSAELYDPTTESWSASGSMSVVRSGHTATLLPNGRVLVAGGYDGTNTLSSAELYDPAAGTWSATGSMTVPLSGHTATLLPSGQVLVVSPNQYAELYDSTTGTWIAVSTWILSGAGDTTTLLPNGKVLTVGGWNSYGPATAQVFYPNGVQLAFTIQPVNGTAGASMPQVQVRAVDRNGNGISGVPINIGIVPSYCTTCTLSGTTSQITDSSGYATFSGLSIDKGSWTYRLVASAPSLRNMIASNSFDLAGFCMTGSMAEARNAHTSTLLPNGKVLVAGGWNGISFLLSSAELNDPASGTWTITGSMATARYQHSATLLPNGTVLVVGGTGTTNTTLSSAELYDPASGTWASTVSMATARSFHTATLLANGKVLVTGGYNPLGYLSSAELYDPASGTWTTTGSMTAARLAHTATLLPNGEVLVAGGYGNGILSSAELYDPASGTWTSTGSMTTVRQYHSATLLPSGKVLVAGGGNSFGLNADLPTAELYDPGSGTWTTTGSMSTGRSGLSATLLPNGKILVAEGGSGYGNGQSSSAELYDPTSGSWFLTGSMANLSDSRTATLLHNGSVLVSGEYNNGYLSSAELFYPAGMLNPIVENYLVEIPFPANGSTITTSGAAYVGIPIIGRVSALMGFGTSASGAYVAAANLAIPTVTIGACSPSAPAGLTATYNIVSGTGSYQYSAQVMDMNARIGSIPNPCGSGLLNLWAGGQPAWWPSGLLNLMPTPTTAPNGDGTANVLLASGLVDPPGQAALPDGGSLLTFGRIQIFPPGTYTVTLSLRIGDNHIATATSTFTVTP